MIVWLSWVVGGAIVVLAALLIAWALFWDRARGRRRCPGRTFSRCWYDMRATDGLRCPECGRVWRSEKQLHRTRRRWGWVWVGLLLMTSGVAVGIWPELTGGRWRHWIPSTALILALPHTEQPWLLDELERRIDGTPQPSQVQWVRRDALWDWQWRLLAKRCGELALLSDVAGIRKTATMVLLSKAPSVSPAIHVLALALADPTHDQRGMVVWGLKSSRYCLDAAAHERAVAALQLAPDADPNATGMNRNESFSRDVAAALDLMGQQDSSSFEPSDGETRQNLAPDEVARRIEGAMADQVAVVQRELGITSRVFTWTTEIESGPMSVERFDLELDGRPGEDCILRVRPTSGYAQEMIVFVRRGGGWRYIGYFDILQMITGVSTPVVVTDPSGRIWIRVRTELGTGAGDTYTLSGESWLRIRNDHLEIALVDAGTDGFVRNTARHPAVTQVQWSLSSAQPRVFEKDGTTFIEYEYTCGFAAGWSSAWDTLDGAADADHDGELFTRIETVRYRWDSTSRQFVPDPGGSLRNWQQLFAMWYSPDGLLDANVDRFVEMARNGSPGRRAWIRLFLSDCEPDTNRATVEAALNETEPSK